jgi:hypothetical protein
MSACRTEKAGNKLLLAWHIKCHNCQFSQDELHATKPENKLSGSANRQSSRHTVAAGARHHGNTVHQLQQNKE